MDLILNGFDLLALCIFSLVVLVLAVYFLAKLVVAKISAEVVKLMIRKIKDVL